MTSQPVPESLPMMVDEPEDPRARALENGTGWSSSDIRVWTETVSAPEVTAPAGAKAPATTVSLRGKYIQRTDYAMRALEPHSDPVEIQQTADPEPLDRNQSKEVFRIISDRARARRYARHEERRDLSEAEEAAFKKRISEALDPPQVIEG